MSNPKSTAQIAGHPIHPMLIPFPVACFVLAFASDIAFWNTQNDPWLHAGGNVIAVVIELYNWYSRYADGTSAIISTGLVLSFVVVLILLFTGWKGWEMVYREHVGGSDAAAQSR